MNESHPKRVTAFRKTVAEYGMLVNASCKPVTSYTATSWSWNNTRSGSELPNWRVLVSQATDATTPFNAFKRRYLSLGDDGYLFLRRKLDPTTTCFSYTAEWQGCIIGFPLTYSTPSLDVTSSLNQAKRVLINRSTDLLRPFMGGVVLAELHKTLHMIRRPAVQLRRALDDYFSELKKIPTSTSKAARRRALVQTYLEGTYGWKPLIYDINGGLQALRDHLKRRPFEIRKITTYGKSEASLTSPVTILTEGIISLLYQQVVRSRVSHRISAGLKLYPTGTLASLPEELGLLPEQFLPTAWELLPYSFFIDYFTNIGNIIDAFSFVQGRLAYCSVTQKTTHTVSYEDLRWNDAYYKTMPFTERTLRPVKPAFVDKWLSRSKLTSIVPNLAFRLPGFGTTTSLNIAALAYQGGVRRPFY